MVWVGSFLGDYHFHRIQHSERTEVSWKFLGSFKKFPVVSTFTPIYKGKSFNTKPDRDSLGDTKWNGLKSIDLTNLTRS